MAHISIEKIKYNSENRGIRFAFRTFLKELIEYYYCSYTEIGKHIGFKNEGLRNYIYSDKGNFEINGEVIDNLIFCNINEYV